MRLAEQEMVIIRKIRMEYRRAVVTLRMTGLLVDREKVTELSQRRDRIIRSLLDEGMAVAQIKVLLGINHHVITNAINNYEDADV